MGAAVIEAVRVVQVQKRIRRMTPLERTRILPSAIIPRPGMAYVLVGQPDVEFGPLCDEAMAARRRRQALNEAAGVLWGGLSSLPGDLPYLVTALAESFASAGGFCADTYFAAIETYWDEFLHVRERNPLTDVVEEMEARGVGRPPNDLPADRDVHVELALFYLTGAFGLDLTDDEAIDALNHCQTATDPRLALAGYLLSIGKDLSEIPQ